MNFTEALTAAVPKSAILRVDTVLFLLDDDDKKAALAALNNPEMPTNTLSTAFAKIGHPISYSAVNKWRRVNGVL